MNRRFVGRIKKPAKDFSNFLHSVDCWRDLKLKNEILNFHWVKCPACLEFCVSSENCFEHLLNHFENSQHFLFQRCNLIFWLQLLINRLKEKSSQKTAHRYGDMQRATNEEFFGDVEINVLFCRNYQQKLPTSNEFTFHLSQHFELKIPAIDPQLKCPLCRKYYCSEESSYKHVFTHIDRKYAHKRPSIIAWLAIFVASVQGIKVLQKYHDYVTKMSSTLLSKILVSELDAVKYCKLCGKPVSSIFDLLENHSKCEVPGIQNPVYCVLCNFEASKVPDLMSHQFLKHIRCYCGYHGKDFNSFLKHSANCQTSKNGIMCPLCCTHKFVSVGAFKEHIERPAKRSCGTLLKNFKWACLLCKQKFPPNEMFHHIFTVHVSCLCGLRFKDFRSFCFHVNECSEKSNMIVCPVCSKMKCYSEEAFEDHILNCLP